MTLSDTTPLIRDCILISTDTIGVNVSLGEVLIVDCEIYATNNISVADQTTAYVDNIQDVTYATAGSGAVVPVQSDRAVWDALNYQARHTNDIDETTGIHWSKAELNDTYLAIGAAAGGDLSGTYPNPSVVNDSHTHNETTLSLSDVTTNDASPAQHGFLQKLSGVASQYLGGDGVFYDLPTVLSLFLDNAASGIAGYLSLITTVPTDTEQTAAATITADGIVIEEFALAAGVFDFISAQVLHIHLHLAKTAGIKTATAYVEVYHRTSGGTETLLGTSNETGNLTGSSTPYSLDVSIDDTVFTDTDRFVIKVIGNQGGAGTDPQVTLYYEGDTNSRIEVGAAPAGGGGIGGSTGATDNAILRADGGGGSTLQNSLATIDDSGSIDIPTGQTYNINGTPHAHAGAGHVIQDEGSDMTQRANLNFVGAGVSVSDDAGNDATVVTIGGGVGGFDDVLATAYGLMLGG